jgi:hypothetical protein
MPTDHWLTTADIKDLFAHEITAAGGTMSDVFDDGYRLFVRSVLPQVREARPADHLQGGVALRAGKEDIWVHPYVFRQVCRNGAIMAHTLQTRHIQSRHCDTVEDTVAKVRAAVQLCCAEDVFTTSVEQIRAACDIDADLGLNLLPFLSRLAPDVAAQLLPVIVRRFFGDADPSRFGLMNAVTEVARDHRDPDIRWRLEELGGGILVGISPVQHSDEAEAEVMLVG